MRRILLALLLAVGVAAAVVAFLSGGAGRDTTQDIAGSLGLVDDPPFRLDLSGRLWQDRTIRSEDGAPDLAYVTSDEPLVVLVTGDEGARVSDVELRVEGRRQRRVSPACPAARCPKGLRVAFTPRLGTASGDRRIQVIAHDPRARNAGTDAGSHTSSVSFTVHRGGELPRVHEGEPVTATAPQPARNASRLRRLRLRALEVVSAARDPGVVEVLRFGFRLRETGELTASGRPLGALLLVDLTPDRRNVSITLPAHVPAANGTTYARQTVRMRAPVLRDLLVDVDLERNRVIAVAPGPQSQTQAWTPSRTSSPAGAADED